MGGRRGSRTPTVIVTLFLCALSLAGAILMVDELNRPLEGFMKISDAPMRYALAHIGGVNEVEVTQQREIWNFGFSCGKTP